MTVSPQRTPAPSTAAPAADALGLYVHWPFCLSKCPYCDFNSHVREWIPQDRWREALLAELRYWAAVTGRRPLGSIFFGGGTPSLMPPATVGLVIETAHSLWDAVPDIEITLEANPSSVEAGRFRDLRAAGVNRVSLGVQALDDASLRFLGRRHGAAEAIAAVRLAARIFPRFSFDLIYARPGQTVAGWRRELADALGMAGEHLSVYQLTIEKGTPFYAGHARGEFELPDEDAQAALYETTQAILEDAGLPAYEISNHARPGAECRHNLVYWTGGDYVGVGPGAHGRVTIDGVAHATEQAPAPEAWLERVERDGHGTRRRTPVDRETRIEELLMMGLRLASGIDRARFAQRAGRPLDDVLDPAKLQRLIDGGFLLSDETSLRATPAGLQRLNAVLAALIA